MDNTIKGKAVWAVITVDIYDKPLYRGYVSLFADREDAMDCAANAAREDADCCGEDVQEFPDDAMWCVGERYSYVVDKINIQ